MSKSTTAPTVYYKTLQENGRSPYQGHAWPRPNGKPGKWVAASGELVVCENGVHLCRRDDLVHWLDAEIFVAEAGGRIIESDDKVVCRKARLLEKIDSWNERTGRLFAADCAERVLPLFESAHPNDSRPRDAIAAARRFAMGEIDLAACSAARSAAYSAALSAARSAAHSATYSAARSAADSAADSAAYSAARSAADSAAYSAADSAAYSAERAWQTDRLFEYLGGERG